MRTILIPLILICSLTQFEGAEFSKTPIIHKECDTFTCYAPEMCTDPDKELSTIDQVKVVRFDGKQKIAADCPAIVRYFLYAKHWALVEIESMKDIATIDSIEFAQKEDSKEKLKLFCGIESTKMKGKYGNKIIYENDKIEAGAKLECKFQVIIDRSTSSKVIEEDSEYNLFIKTKNGITQKGDELTAKMSCDPSYLLFYPSEISKEDSKKALYEKVKYKPGKYFCEKDLYHFEYRAKDKKEEGYKPVKNIRCEGKRFVITDENGETNFDGQMDPIDVRCASEAKYHCTYKPKAIGEGTPLDFTPPSAESKQEAILKCPDKQPILNIVRGKIEKAYLEHTIECVNFGSNQFWVVKDQNLNDQKLPDQKLTETGPPVYCSAKVDCKTQFKLSNSQVKNGIRNPKTFLPECSEGGTLLAGEKEVLEKGCNEATGRFFYTVEAGKPVNFDTTTQFVCKYKPKKDEAKNAADRKTVWTGVAIAGVAAAVVFTALVVGVCCIMRCQKRREMLKKGARQIAIYKRFGVGKDEQKKIDKANAAKKKADDKAELARLAKQSKFEKFVERWIAKKAKKEETSKDDMVCLRREGALPNATPEIKEGNKWSKWHVDVMLRGQKLAHVQERKTPTPRPIDDVHKLEYTNISMDKKKNPPVEYVWNETDYITDLKSRGLKKGILQIGAAAKEARRQECIRLQKEAEEKEKKKKKKNENKKKA